MIRRLFQFLASAAFAAAMAADAQQAGRIYRVGMLLGSPDRPDLDKAFVDELGRLGFVNGRNLDMRWAYSPGDVSAQARDLISFQPDALVAEGTLRTRALQSLTKSIPIVFVAADPVGGGLVHDLVRPGGNTTGVATFLCDLMVKQLELLRELAPSARRVVMIRQSVPGGPCEHAEDAMRSRVKAIVNWTDQDRVPAMRALLREDPDAILDPNVFFRPGDAAVLKHPLPIVSAMMSPGILVSLHHDQGQVVQRQASLVARILNGASPGELPVEFPLGVQVEVNVALARQLRISIPASILLRADRLIE